MLTHKEPVLRALTLRLLGRIRAKEAAMQIMGLAHDATPVTIPDQGGLYSGTVAQLASEALQLIHQEDEHVDRPTATAQ